MPTMVRCSQPDYKDGHLYYKRLYPVLNNDVMFHHTKNIKYVDLIPKQCSFLPLELTVFTLHHLKKLHTLVLHRY